MKSTYSYEFPLPAASSYVSRTRLRSSRAEGPFTTIAVGCSRPLLLVIIVKNTFAPRRPRCCCSIRRRRTTLPPLTQSDRRADDRLEVSLINVLDLSSEPLIRALFAPFSPRRLSLTS
jgi:hypothetical protein